MVRNLLLASFVFALTVAVNGCGGSTEPTVIEDAAMTETEMQSYEEEMNAEPPRGDE